MTILRTAVIGIVILAAILSPTPAGAQIVCDWKSTNAIPPLKGSNNIVEWASTADHTGQDLWNFSTMVVNVDKGPRDIVWTVGGLIVDGLKPRHYALLCTKQELGRIDRMGPLYFARDRSSMPTTVYGSRFARTNEKTLTAGAPVELEASVTITEDDKKRPVDVRVTTQVVRRAKDYQIIYTVENMGAADVSIDLSIDPDVALEMGKGDLLLKPKQKQTTTVTTGTFPQMVRYPMRVTSKPLDTSAIATVPTARKTPPQRNQD